MTENRCDICLRLTCLDAGRVEFTFRFHSNLVELQGQEDRSRGATSR